MTIPRPEIELAAINYAHALDILPETIGSWDAGAWRGPRLLVPVTVEALVMAPGEAGRDWASVRLTADSARPQPFDTYTGRAPGVHLHWALPDGLTRATHEGEPDAEEPPAPAEVDGPPQTEQPPERRLRFRLIPDRWLVVRIHGPANQPRRVHAWVIDSEPLDPARRVTALGDWREDRTTPRPPRTLTAVGPADTRFDPAFAAYYDNVQGVLGFHDALEDVTAGPLTYMVAGWYSQPSDDPLYAPATRQAWFATLQALGWSLGDGAEERVRRAAGEVAERLGQVGLPARTDDPAPGFLVADATQLAPMANQPAAGPEATAAAAILPSPVLGQQAAAIGLTPALSGLAAIASEALIAYDNIFLRYWPRQVLCHGTVYDVPWAGRGGAYAGVRGMPAAGTVRVAVGNTGVEALAALVADRGGGTAIERLASAFHYGLLPALDEPDGLTQLESLLHSEAFGSLPGGFVVDTIDQGDIVPPEDPPRGRADRVVRPPVSGGFRGIGKYEINLQYAPSSLQVSKYGLPGLIARQRASTRINADALSAGRRAVTPQGGARAVPRETIPIRRALPRFFTPNDPVVLLTEPRRSFKHGRDGRFNADNLLDCRLTGDPVRSISVVVDRPAGGAPVRATITATELRAQGLVSGQIPREARELFDETLLLDESNAAVAAAVVLGTGLAAIGAQGRRFSVAQMARRVRVEQTLLWNSLLRPDADAQALAAISGIDGMRPSKVGWSPWRPPWTPLHLDWEVEWFPSPGLERDWRLGEHDFDPAPGTDPPAGATPAATFSGRTLLTPGAADTMAAAVARFLEDEQNGSADLATPEQEHGLREVRDALVNLDVLATSLGGLREQLLGMESGQRFPVRAGHLRLRRLRIIDAFSQYYDVTPAAVGAPVVAEALRGAAAGLVRLPPRITQPARLMFRLVAADDDTVEATRRRSPVCGWLLPDHLDEALEFFDAAGVAQGQVQPSLDGPGAEWQGVPGTPAPLGGPPTLANPHLQGLATGLLAEGLSDAAAGVGTAERSEPVLPALLRMIDATLWTIDPLGREGDEHLSVLIGRPLAVARARLSLDLRDAPATDELARTGFPVRLGLLTRLYDGLIGYFVNDDYRRFYPVHETIAEQARPAGPRTGFLGAAAASGAFYAHYADTSSIQPVRHPYIDRTPVVLVRPGQPVMLTLVIDPRGAVHATSGILPRKRIELMREHIAAALDAIAVTFRVGPVLTDPEQIRMPLPAEIRGGWSWVRRTAATVWEERPVEQATQDALLSSIPAEINEGWLKLSGALGREPEEP